MLRHRTDTRPQHSIGAEFLIYQLPCRSHVEPCWAAWQPPPPHRPSPIRGNRLTQSSSASANRAFSAALFPSQVTARRETASPIAHCQSPKRLQPAPRPVAATWWCLPDVFSLAQFTSKVALICISKRVPCCFSAAIREPICRRSSRAGRAWSAWGTRPLSTPLSRTTWPSPAPVRSTARRIVRTGGRGRAALNAAGNRATRTRRPPGTA